MDSSTTKLNSRQQEAVTHEQGPLLIVAGAGTGKTTVLINRLAHLVLEKGYTTDEILLLTFTEKSASELEARADILLPYGYFDLWIHTFHGFCERVLREHAFDIGLSADFKLLSATDQWILIKKNLNRFNLKYYKPLGNPTKFISEMLRHFSRLKDENISDVDYLSYTQSLTDEDAEEINRLQELATAYKVYNELLIENNFLDFGDLIVYTLKLLKTRSNILNAYRRQFKQVMVDEFQDTNWAQYELVKLLVESSYNLTVVGDDDQCLPGSVSILTKHGQKKIKDIKVGEEVASAVGKGYLSYSPVSHVNKNKKKCRLLTFTLKSGKKITVTDNHKLFCFTPRISNKNYYYVYLMFKQELGWRIGMTNDLATRLRLERSTDSIMAVGCYNSLEEARYNEVLLSLKYGIPTSCFQERDGIMDKKIWSHLLYKELKVDDGVRLLAQDKNLDLTHPPYCLQAVKRGNKSRIIISLEMCARSYRSEYDKNGFLDHPQILHSLYLETSDTKVIASLKKIGIPITAAKKGQRVRITSVDFSYLGALAKKIQQEIGGFIEVKMKIAKNKKQHLKSLVIPAQNVFPGMSLPVMSDNGLVYEEIISRAEKEKVETVYDLEVERTHNFIANGVAVHNSIYKFRGASISNIMQFKDDYPQAKEIVLIDNYRSRQEILDHAYRFIKHNDPNRLEVKLKIDKQLKSGGVFENNDEEPACYLQFDRGEDEVAFVAVQIADLYKQKKELNWLDMAILVRANDTAEPYVKELTRLGIPNQFVSLKGLYYKPIVLDCLAYLRLLDNYHESSALFRVLSMPAFKVSHLDLININKYARQKVWSLFEALKNCSVIPGLSNESLLNINQLLTLLEKHSALVADTMPTKLFLRFVYDSGLVSDYDFDRDQEIFSYLNQIYQKIKKFEETLPGARLHDFMELMDLEMEAGEVGALRLDFSDNDTVKIMTVHAAKGLEFKHVFLVNAVDKKFPTISRSEKISIPDTLVKEKMLGGKEAHLEEERRLFYVAITRAKESLYITGAKDYGGVREKKPSLFISEMGLDVMTVSADSNPNGKSELMRDLKRLDEPENIIPEALILPDRFSFSQLAAFSNCPLQYKFAFVLKIPAPSDKASLIFGRVLHNVLYEFLEPLLASKQAFQDNLFGSTTTKNSLKEEALLEIYERRWQNDGYASIEERDNYYKKGKEIVRQFLKNWESESAPEVLFLEKSFSFKVGGDIIKGAIDRIDRLKDESLEVIDYKTGNPKEKLTYEDKRQLILYKIFLEETYGQKVSLLSYYYLESGHKVSFAATDKEIEKLRSEILREIAEIKKGNFPPKPSELCKYCDFRSICEFKQN